MLGDFSEEFCFTVLMLSDFSEEFCFTLLVLSVTWCVKTSRAQ